MRVDQLLNESTALSKVKINAFVHKKNIHQRWYIGTTYLES